MKFVVRRQTSMFQDTRITGGRFLEFNGGDWFMMLCGFTLAALLVLLI
jgi:hypothetical protein